MKRRKAVRKESIVPVRMTEKQKRDLGAAAEKAGLGLSTWLLVLGLRAIKQNIVPNTEVVAPVV